MRRFFAPIFRLSGHSRPRSSSIASLLLVVCSLVVDLACESTSAGPDTGGETHFLRRCDANNNVCGSALVCICGACTRPCDASSICPSFDEAQCVSSDDFGARDGSCDADQEQQVCEVFCDEDQDCSNLSSAHQCVQGACRLNEPDSSETAESAGGFDGDSDSSACDDTTLLANEVVVLGDSFFATTHQITGYLEELAREAGALSDGYRYRDYSRLSNNALAWMGEGISDQYQQAIAEGAVRVVIMNGGGADVLLGACESVQSSCPLLVNAAAAFEELLDQMSDDGIEHIVFAGYPDPVPTEVKELMDLLRPSLVTLCSQSTVPCQWLDLRDDFQGHYDDYINPGGLNPTAAGARVTAEAIWSTLMDQCIAQ